jgi:predicted TIM-barrel fold metal-dependent hydrolase
MIIDAHVHLFDHGYIPPAWHDATAWRWSARTFPARDASGLRARIMDGLVDPNAELLGQDLDKLGIDAVVCIGLDWSVALGPQDVSLEDMHELYRSVQMGEVGSLKGRFFTIAGIDPRREGAVPLLDRFVLENQCKGLKLYPPCGYYPYDEACQPLLARCRELGVPVVVHSSPGGYPMRTRFAHPYGISDVQVAYPELTIVLAHAGHGGWVNEAKDVAARHPNTYLELSNWQHDLASDPDGVASRIIALRNAVGAHRIIFGSDNFGGRRFGGSTERSTWISFLQELPKRATQLGSSFSTEEVELILGQNAIRVYGLEVDRG